MADPGIFLGSGLGQDMRARAAEAEALRLKQERGEESAAGVELASTIIGGIIGGIATKGNPEGIAAGLSAGRAIGQLPAAAVSEDTRSVQAGAASALAGSASLAALLGEDDEDEELVKAVTEPKAKAEAFK